MEELNLWKNIEMVLVNGKYIQTALNSSIYSVGV